MSEIAFTSVRSLRQVFFVIIGVAVMVISSHCSVSIGPVPITLQTAGVHLLALTLPPGRAALSVLLWITWGVLGSPVFALFTSGAEKVCGVTGGYFIGMLLAAPAMALCQFHWARFFNTMFSNKKEQEGAPLNFAASVVVGLLGSTIILLCGWFYFGWSQGYTFAFIHGVLPFLIPSVLKNLLVSYVVTRFKLEKIGA
jgi:biotin transport system substrate-specific component